MEIENIYNIYSSDTIDRNSCIEIQLGKQKKKKFKDTSRIFTFESFLPLEQTIWNNFREYSSNSVVRIRTEEWSKIIRGLKKLSISLKETSFQYDLLELLGFKSKEDKKRYESNFSTINPMIDNMIEKFIEWIEPSLDKEDYITITAS